MKRTNQSKRPDAILVADMHLREDTPICRTDNFWEVQWKKVDFISELQQQYDCPVLHAGDLFHHWKPSPNLLRETMVHLPKRFYTVYGQHDLPQHNLGLSYKCGIDALAEAEKLTILRQCHWGKEPNNEWVPSYQRDYFFPIQNPRIGRQSTEGASVLVWHTMVYAELMPFPGCTGLSADKLLKKYLGYDLIVTGDNHIPFVAERDGRLLVNPGSMMRTTADQVNHRPRVYLWYAQDNTVEPVYIPIEQDVISREHIELAQERDGRIDAFVSRLNDDWEASVSFEENLERFKHENKVRQSVMDIVYKAIEK